MTVVKIKKQKTQKKYVMKRKLKFKNYKNCLEAPQLENKTNHLEKNEIEKNNKLILKTQQTVKIERYIVFTEEINKIALSSNDDKRMQSIDLIETYAYGTRKDLVSEEEEIKWNNIIKRYKNH